MVLSRLTIKKEGVLAEKEPRDKDHADSYLIFLRGMRQASILRVWGNVKLNLCHCFKERNL